MSALEIVSAYHRAGWALVALHGAPGGVCTCRRTDCDGNSRGKHPRAGEGWPSVRYAEADLADVVRGNVGLILGPASGGLADVDLDCDEAITLAPAVLPPRALRFGRPSKPRSHWIIRSP